ncbi:MAG: hypothetical protein OXI10_15110 [Gammaproteobacteria bacterium]|nr:hypothetical protein [Gammaproteobacteria bacterium]MXY65060.1 hypothetical protein [Gammaproteobacteria bacterium]MYG65204.1 hypothetical protein [Gammaproteobacteria bacterium]
MNPDIAICNATTARPVIVAHSRKGRALLAGHYGMKAEEIDWVCIGRVSTTGNLGFGELHGKIIPAHVIVRNDQASETRLDEPAGGAYPAKGTNAPNPGVAWGGQSRMGRTIVAAPAVIPATPFRGAARRRRKLTRQYRFGQ